MKRVKNNRERFVIDKRGELQAVIMGIEDFIRTVTPEPDVIATIRAEAKRRRKDKLSMRDIDREIAVYRRERKLAK